MAPSAMGDAQSLPAFLAARARRASDLRLALNAGAGLLVAIGAVLSRPHFWVPVLALGTSFLCYGAWGILDREFESATPSRRRTLAIARASAAAIGAIAGVGFLLTFFFQFVGTWIS